MAGAARRERERRADPQATRPHAAWPPRASGGGGAGADLAQLALAKREVVGLGGEAFGRHDGGTVAVLQRQRHRTSSGADERPTATRRPPLLRLPARASPSKPNKRGLELTQ